MNGTVSIIGCGFVADLYMRSIQAMDGITVAGVYDKNPERLAQFCTFWNVPPVGSMEALLDRHPRDGVVLNLTNPSAHFEVNSACLAAGCHTYSEKPLAMSVDDAKALHA